jgi:hypothetical protein
LLPEERSLYDPLRTVAVENRNEPTSTSNTALLPEPPFVRNKREK